MTTTDAPLLKRSIHTLAVPDVYSVLETDPSGLSEAEVLHRLALAGPNRIREAQRTPLWRRLGVHFTHLMALLLWSGGLVAFIARMPQLGIAVWLVNLINGAFSFWQEFRAEQATEALRKLLPSYARALRDGEERRVDAGDLVPGDIVLLAEGDRISADARLVQEAELLVEQATLTGESHPSRKTCEAVRRTDLAHTELPNLVFAGTSVAAGTGKAAVFATGMNTEFGTIARLTQTTEDQLSPLQLEMKSVTRSVTLIAVLIGLIFFALAVLLAGTSVAESFIFALGMIVAFVPEGLLPTVTLALAMGTQRMARRSALVKRLSAVETLGCTTAICTDKTGTLTQNEMTVRALWCAGRQFDVAGVGYSPEGHITDRQTQGPVDDTGDLRQLLVAAGVCTNARLLPERSGSSGWTVLGDPTEAALLVVARKAGLDLTTCEGPRLRELPFDSRRKRMTTVHDSPGGPVAYVKGAPREILALCSRVRQEGEEVPLTETTSSEIISVNDDYARSGLRVLAVAMRRLGEGDFGAPPEAIERELTLLGLVAMMDPPRPEVADAVRKCHLAGIRIVMITGDYGLTAESVARRIGIVTDEQVRIVTGVELEAMDSSALREALQGQVIFARVAPEHKLRVVSELQGLGHVVAVTGDGVNDAPALKKADIGVAMGIAGTDVAKEAADAILTDDDFSSIVSAVEEGRAVYDNIKKFTTYIFTSNAPEAVPFILYALSRARIPLALNVMHVLCIDLGTDMVPALALGAELPEPGLMDRPPRNLKEHIITPALLKRAYLWLGPVQSLAAMAAFFYQYWSSGYRGRWFDLPDSGPVYLAATAMALGAVVTTQIGNVFAQRSETLSIRRVGLRGNRMLWVGVASELLLAALFTYVPFFQRVIGTAAFDPRQWLFLLAWTPSLILVDELRKALARQRGRPERSSFSGGGS